MNTFLELLLLGFFVIYPSIGWLTFERRRRSVQEGRSSRWHLYTEIVLVEWSATALVAGLWLLNRRSANSLGLGWPTGDMAWLAWTLAALALGGLAMQVLKGRKSADWRRLVRSELASVDTLMPTRGHEMAGFTAVSFTAGFCEEVLYRGFLFWWFQNLGWGVAPAAVGTVVAFGLAHIYQGRKGMLKTAVAGGVLIALTLLAGSLWPAILLHIGGDLIGGWTAMAARPKASDEEDSMASRRLHAV